MNSTTRHTTNQTIQNGDPVALDLTCDHYWGKKHPFRLKLHFHALVQLMNDALNGVRIYELMMIRRPGDVWNYIWVEAIDVPPRVQAMMTTGSLRWPAGYMPFLKFDGMFRWALGDTDPEDECWLRARGERPFAQLADQMFAQTKVVQAKVRSSPDILTVHVLAALDARRHRSDYLAVPPIYCTLPDYQPHYEPLHSAGYYSKLEELLASPDVTSAGFTRDDDFHAIRLACAEQRKRANATGLEPEDAFFITMSSDGLDYLEEWEAQARCYSEGIGCAYLFVVSPDSLRACLTLPRRRFPIFFVGADTGEIEGYSKLEGDGWFTYTRTTPYEGRLGF